MKVRCGETPQPARETRALPRIRDDAVQLFHDHMPSYLHRLRGGLVPLPGGAIHDSHSSFCEEVLSCRTLLEPESVTPAAGITDPSYSGTNEVERANILAPGLRRISNFKIEISNLHPSSRLHRRLAPDDWLVGSRIQLQQRNCSRFTRDFSRRSTNQTRKELSPEVAACASALNIYLSASPKSRP